MSIYKKFLELLRKDIGTENESTKLRYVVRLILLLCVFYNFVATLLRSIFVQVKGTTVFVAFFFLFVAVFALTYAINKTEYVLLLTHVSMLCWISAFVRLFGWDSGIQSLLLLLLVLNFFSGYKLYLKKSSYALFLFVFRMLLFGYTRSHSPAMVIGPNFSVFSQFTNSLFSFFLIGLICFIFSRDSQVLEGKLVEYNIQLVNQANTDPLTGLNNRRKTMEYLESLVSDGRTVSLCVSICDIDFFKKVNDTYGHDIGDKVLKSIAQTMMSTLGENCFVSRWGGEEFLIVFANVNGDEAYIKLHELSDQISKLNFEVKDRSFKITMTYGLAEYDFHSDVLGLIKEADNKLYYGKENGRNQVVY